MTVSDKVQIGGLVVLLLGGVYAFGEFNGRLKAAEARLGQLETKVDPLRTLRVGKGDLCLKLLEQLPKASLDQREQLSQRFDELECGAVAAAVERIPDPTGVGELQNAVQALDEDESNANMARDGVLRQ